MKNKQEKQAPNKWGSWELFVIAIGTLVIVTAPMYDKPIIVVIHRADWRVVDASKPQKARARSTSQADAAPV